MTHRFQPPRLIEWAAEVRRDPVPTWIVEPFIPHDNLVLISGSPKDAKKTWLGMWLALEAAKHVPVIFCYREGARRATLQRFDALTDGLEEDVRTRLYSNIYFLHRGSFYLDDQEQMKATVKFVKSVGAKLFFVDTFAKSVQSDENSSRDMGRAIHSTERIREAGASVVLTHHTRKSANALSNGTMGTPEPDKDLRGSSALAGAYETHLAVRSYGDGPVLLVGGKEAEWKAYRYSWLFEQADEGLKSVSLNLTDMVMPSIGEEE